MSVEVWLAYVAAYSVISLIPGPSVFMVLGQSLSRGLGAALYCIAGDLLEGIVVMTVAYAGLGTILAVSSDIYALIKWVCVGYMASSWASLKSSQQGTWLNPTCKRQLRQDNSPAAFAQAF